MAEERAPPQLFMALDQGIAALIDFRPESRSLAAGILAGSLAGALLAVMASKLINHEPLWDELTHYLAAQGLRAHGVPSIDHGIYDRALWFTWIVAVAQHYLGDSLAASRVPGVVASVALVLMTTVWVSRRVDLLAGVAAGACLLMLPATVELAVFLRFYSLHALLVMGMAIAAYEAIGEARTRAARVAFGAAAALLCLLALEFQLTTIISLGAVVTGVLAVFLLDYRQTALSVVRRYPIVIGGGILVAAVAGSLAASHLGLFKDFSEAPLWNAYAANRPQYYALEFARVTPLLWPLLPAAAVAAFAKRRRITAFFAAAFVFAFAAHSAAAAKQMRYIYHALPFMCVILGVGLSSAYALAGRARARVLWVAAIAAALSQEGSNAARLVAGRGMTSDYAGETDWSPAVPVLAPLVSRADRIVTSNSLKALYYLGRYDYELDASMVQESETGKEFGRDERTGRLSIGTADSTRRILDMPGRTLFVLEDKEIGDDSGVPAAAVDAVAARCEPVVVPPAAGIHAWSCVAPADRP